MSEEVLVVQRRLLEPFLASGDRLITSNTDTMLKGILAEHHFVPRSAAEYDFDLKQIIPYVVVRCRESFLLLRRTSKQTEKRLHNKYSLGIGGHINPPSPDDKGRNIITKGLYRELNEEVRLPDPGRLSFEGIINDEGSSVGKVHLGLFYVLDVESDDYSIRERDKMVGKWAGEEGISEVHDQMETWSQIIFDLHLRRSRQ